MGLFLGGNNVTRTIPWTGMKRLSGGRGMSSDSYWKREERREERKDRREITIGLLEQRLECVYLVVGVWGSWRHPTVVDLQF